MPKISDAMIKTHELLRQGLSAAQAARQTGISTSAISMCKTCREIINAPPSVRHLPLKERFEAKFRVTPGCWIWEASITTVGYGQIKAGTRMEKAHRVSYRLYIGDIPDGMHVLHRCDNRLCVNPAHFFLGRQLENMRDMETKGRARQPKGEKNSNAKLTAEKALAIRASAEDAAVLAEKYGVSEFAIRDVRIRRTWKHV